MTGPVRWIGLILFILLCLAAGAIGAMATATEVDSWYRTIQKPPWNPPDALFGPVWTLLYVGMGIAAWLVWQGGHFADHKVPLGLFAIQLLLNILWPILFFALRSPGLAALEIGLLWLAILMTLLAFWKRSRWAGGLLIPYLAWVSFAAFLNVVIWRMNLT